MQGSAIRLFSVKAKVMETGRWAKLSVCWMSPSTANCIIYNTYLIFIEFYQGFSDVHQSQHNSIENSIDYIPIVTTNQALDVDLPDVVT